MRQKTKTKRIFWLSLVIGLVLLSGFLKVVQEAWWTTTSQAQGFFWQVGYYLQWWAKTPQLLKERDDLLAKRDTWYSDQAKLLNLEQENNTLQKALKFVTEKKLDYLGVRVLTKDKLNERLIIVDQGQNSGIERDQPLINEQGVVLGKVVDVSSNRATILLLNDPKSQLAVALEGVSTLGLIHGRLGGGLVMDYIPLDVSLKINQLVYTSGLEPTIPAGLIVGQIVSIKKEIGNLFQEASVQSLVNFQEINQGWIIR